MRTAVDRSSPTARPGVALDVDIVIPVYNEAHVLAHSVGCVRARLAATSLRWQVVRTAIDDLRGVGRLARSFRSGQGTLPSAVTADPGGAMIQGCSMV